MRGDLRGLFIWDSWRFRWGGLGPPDRALP